MLKNREDRTNSSSCSVVESTNGEQPQHWTVQVVWDLKPIFVFPSLNLFKFQIRNQVASFLRSVLTYMNSNYMKYLEFGVADCTMQSLLTCSSVPA